MNTYLAKFYKKLGEQKIDAFLITNPTNIQYLSGFTAGDCFLLVMPGKAYFITDSRYTTQAEEEITDKSIKLSIHKDGLYKKAFEIVNAVPGRKIKQLGFESAFTSLAAFKELKKGIGKNIKLVPTQSIIEQIRAIKTPGEIAKIRIAVNHAANVFNFIRGFIRPGISEKDISCEMEYYMRKKGAEHSAFTEIIGVNERAALPHAPLSNKKLTPHCAVLFDWGACVNMYNSDCTRVLFLGEPTPKAKEIYDIVLEAQMRAIAKSKPGVKIKELDETARGYIKATGYGDYFGHGLGHGIGRMVHELPGIKFKTEEVLKPGMIFTVEPGIYLPGKVGVRIEDMVLVTEKGCEVLTKDIPKELSRMRIS